MPLQHLFPLSIYNSKIVLNSDYKNELINLILKSKSDKILYNRYKEGSFAWTGDQEGHSELHNLEVFKILFDQIKIKIIDYLDLLNIDYSKFDIFFQRSWSTISNNNEFISKHNHAQSNISFAYYLKKTQNDSKIIFWDNNKANEIIPELFSSPTVKSKNIIKKKDENNSSNATIDPKENDIIIFPSKTFHSTQQKKENSNRITISADISLYAKDSIDLEHLTPPITSWKKF